MAKLASPEDLEAYLQQPLDSNTASLVLDVVSALFEREADTKFEPTEAAYQVEGVGQRYIDLPRLPVISVQSVTVGGDPITDWTLIGTRLYRAAGFGFCAAVPPVVEVTYTYGYPAVPDDVRGAVLESAALAYTNPDLAVREQIDDYAVQRAVNSGGVGLTPSAAKLAHDYRIGAVA